MILVGGMTRMPRVPREGGRDLRQEAPGRREPRRGGGDRRRDPGRRAEGRGRGRAAPRRDAALARRRDPGRRLHQDHREEHHDPHARRARCSRPPRTTRRWCASTCSRASARWRPTTRASAASSWSASRRRRAACPQIEVTFEIDTDGVVSVSAKDLGTGKSQAIRVTASGGLTKDEIDRLVQEAEENTDADKARRQLADLPQQGRRPGLLDRAHPRGVRRARGGARAASAPRAHREDPRRARRRATSRPSRPPSTSSRPSPTR